jgi:hypothetical protein
MDYIFCSQIAGGGCLHRPGLAALAALIRGELCA